MVVFKNKAQQKFFDFNGYCTLDLLDGKEVNQLKAIYDSLQTEHKVRDLNLHSTVDNDNKNLISIVEQEISTAVLPILNKHFQSYDYLFSTFLIKASGKGNKTPFHQDPTLVESNKFVSANIWIALQDTTIENGALTVIPGSHRITNSLVVTPEFPTFYENFQEKLPSFCRSLPVKKGQAIIFNNKLVHGAHANKSSSDRIAAVLAVKSIASPWCYYFRNEKSKLEKYLIDKASYAELKKNQRPPNPISKSILSYNFPQLEFSDFKKFMLKNYPLLFFKSFFK